MNRTLSTILILAAAIVSAAEDGSSGKTDPGRTKPNNLVKPTGPQGSPAATTVNQDKPVNTPPAQRPLIGEKATPPIPLDKVSKSPAITLVQEDGSKRRGDSATDVADESHPKTEEVPASYLWIYLGLTLVVLLQILLLRLSRDKDQSSRRDEGGQVGVGHDGFTYADRLTLSDIKKKVGNVAPPQLAKTEPLDKLNDVATKVAAIAVDVKQLAVAGENFQELLVNAQQDLAKAQKDLAPAREEILSLKDDLDALRKVEERTQQEMLNIKSERDSLRASVIDLENHKNQLRDQQYMLERDNRGLADFLRVTEGKLAEAVQESHASASQLEASFLQLAPKTLVDPEILALMRKLHGQALSGSVSAAAAWSTLTAFASAEADPQAKDFQLHILKRLGAVLVNYWKGQGSPPKDSHERLTHWARCLNEQAKGRYNLFVPAIGAPVDRTKMTTASSASIVQEVLCWQVRNPAGANYSLAEVA
jgi:hypothetical protein